MAYQRFDGTMSFLPSRFEAQAMLSEMQKKKDEEMKLLRLKQAEEQKHQTEALRSELNRMLTELKAMTANREATMSKFFSQTSIPPRPPFPPPDPPDIRKSRQDLTIKAPDLPDFNQSELISTNQVPNKLTLRYSCEEIHERMTNGLCIFCEDLDTPGHYNLKHKRSKICLVECVDDRLPDEELVEPTVEEISNKSVTMIQDEESNLENESRPEFSHQVLLSQVQHTPTNQYRAPFNPCQNHSDKPHNKSKFGNCVGHEIEFDRDSDEIEDDELQDKQPEEDVETLVINENEQSLECVDDESSVDEKLIEVIAEGTALDPMDESGCKVDKERNLNSLLLPESQIILLHIETIRKIGLIQEPELTDAILEVDCIHSQELSSQFQVPIPSLEPSRICRKESLVVVNDVSYDIGCVIGKTIGSVCVSELCQDNSLDEEEFKGFKLGKLLKNERQFSIVCLLGIMDMSCWTQFSALVKAYEMSLLGRDKWKWSEKHMTYNNARKFKYIQRFMLSVLLQNEQHKLLQGMNIKCKMKKMEVLRRIKQFIFIELQLHMKNNSEFNFQANTRDAELETTSNDGDTFQKALEDFYRACAYDHMALRVLELIKDRASRKGKLHKNWWFKYKLNTWLSEALHCWRKRKHERLQRASEDMMCELIYKIRKACHCVVHETNQTASHVWYGWITKAEIISIPIMDLKGKEETFSFNIAVKSCSMFYFFPYSTWMVSQNRHASAGCALGQEENYLLVLFIIIEALTLFNDQHTLVTEKNGTETSTVLKQIFGLATHQLLLKQSLSQVLLHIQNRDCSFFGYMRVTTSDCFGTLLEIPDKEIGKPHRIFFLTLLIQWKWYPPTQAIRSFTKLSMTSNQILYP